MNPFKVKLLLSIMLTLLSISAVNAKTKIKLNDLFVYEKGVENVKTIVFLHGSGANSNMWLKHIDSLKETFHCIAPDLPGHGQSNQIEWTNIDEVADVIAELIKTKGYGKVHLVGLSLGGSLIYKLLEKYPELIDKAIIDGASAIPIKGAPFVIFGVKITSPFLKTNMMINIMAKSLKVPDEEFDSFKNDFKLVSRKSFRRALSQANRVKIDIENCNYKTSVFYVSGETESNEMHYSHQYLSNKIPNSECAYYPCKGHAWMVSDIKTHIQLVRYWFLGENFPELLKKNG
ncbi:MAG: hypothetical protein H6Q25_1046 [Bacteroidetes bacterium]|nr:hypothetical protein [Bacteroidota bacterium]